MENVPVNQSINQSVNPSMTQSKPVKQKAVKRVIEPYVPKPSEPLTVKQAYDYWVNQSINQSINRDDARTLEAYQMIEWLRTVDVSLKNEKSNADEITRLIAVLDQIDQSTNQSVSQSADQTSTVKAAESTDQSINQSANQPKSWITPTTDSRFYKFTRSGDVIIHVQNTRPMDPARPAAVNQSIHQSINHALMCRYRCPVELFDRLHAWQKEGLHFLCQLHASMSGGILGDDMGLGKTCQSLCFVSTLAHSQLINQSMIIAPLAVLVNWEREIEQWCPAAEMFNYHRATEAQRAQYLETIDQPINQSVNQSINDADKSAINQPIKEVDPEPAKPRRTKRTTKASAKTSADLETDQSIDLSSKPSQESTNQSAKSLPSPLKSIPKSIKLMLINLESFSGAKGTSRLFDSLIDGFAWDFVCVDEGHRLKNADSVMTQSIKRLPSLHRILLTGTPVQNELNELWSLMDFCCHGRLLGERRAFREQYASRIERGLAKDASVYMLQQARQYAQYLKSVLAPHMLARDKNSVGLHSSGVLTCSKTDLTVWLKLSPSQLKLYKDMLESKELKQLLNSSRSPLVAINLLRKVCQHEKLVTASMNKAMDSISQAINQSNDLSIDAITQSLAQTSIQATKLDDLDADDDEPLNQPINQYSISELIEGSEKLRVLLLLLEYHRSVGHRTVVFSQRARMLDLIEPVLTDAHLRYVRVDGSVRSSERQVRLDAFQNDQSIDVCLLTTGVGSVGLNLVSAARVIVIDPSWNPAVDAQAVDRCYRIGQKRDVVIHRLVSASTVEDVVYQRQVYKSAVSHTVNARKQQLNEGLFTSTELRDVFKAPNQHESSRTQQMLTDKYPLHTHTLTEEVQKHIQWLNQQSIWGITDHAKAAAGKEQVMC